MLRESLLYLSASPTAQRLITGTPLSRQLAERFVAGETLDDAMRVSRECNEQGLSVTLDYLGEAVGDMAAADHAVEMAIRTLEGLARDGLDGNVSLKPSQFGLDIDGAFCRENLERVVKRARELGDDEEGMFVRLDMESSEYTERTLDLVESLWDAGYRNVGTVLQSYLRRTPADLERLVEKGIRVRLVKGAYNEPAATAYPDKSDVDDRFEEQMKILLERGNRPAIATHDETMIVRARRFAFEKGIPKESFEFQMLYGIRRDLQVRLQEERYAVRVYVPFGESWYAYLMRRMAERPANVVFVTANVLRESPAGVLMQPVALGAGVVAGSLAALAWRHREPR